MKNVAILGLSSFGTFLCRTLTSLGVEVLAVDANESRVETVTDLVKRAVVADATSRDALEQLGLEDFDYVVVSLGEKLDASILATLYLKQAGVENLLVKALHEDHETIMSLLGVENVIIPERDMAERVAHRLKRKNLLDFIPIGEGFSVMELETPGRWVGKALSDLHVHRDYQVQIFFTRSDNADDFRFPTGDHVLREGEILLLGGRDEDLGRLEKL